MLTKDYCNKEAMKVKALLLNMLKLSAIIQKTVQLFLGHVQRGAACPTPTPEARQQMSLESKLD